MALMDGVIRFAEIVHLQIILVNIYWISGCVGAETNKCIDTSSIQFNCVFFFIFNLELTSVIEGCTECVLFIEKHIHRNAIQLFKLCISGCGR